MKKLKLANDGLVVKNSISVTKQPKPSSVRSNPVQPITAEFIREIKSELVKELAQLLVGLGSRAISNALHPLDETTNNIPKIDESVVVSTSDLSNIEKKFDSITEETITSEDVSSSIAKLKALKKVK